MGKRRGEFPEVQGRKRWVGAFDVGTGGVGMAAIEIGGDPKTVKAYPKSILNMTSELHDSGVDPTMGQNVKSRKKSSGEARRRRNREDHERKRLRELDMLLGDGLVERVGDEEVFVKGLGLPVDKAKALSPEEDDLDGLVVGDDLGKVAWSARLELVSGYIEDDAQRKLGLAVAIRAIARHRGWRNPWLSVKTVERDSSEPSRYERDFLRRMEKWYLHFNVPFPERWELSGPDRLTVAQILRPVVFASDDLKRKTEGMSRRERRKSLSGKDRLMAGKASKVRGTPEDLPKGTPAGTIERLHQSDLCHELDVIMETQRVGVDDSIADEGERNRRRDEVRWAIREKVFHQISPEDNSGAADKVGIDDLQLAKKRTVRRAPKSSPEFQRYRILTTIDCLRVEDDGVKRELDSEEREKVYRLLTEGCVSGLGMSESDVPRASKFDEDGKRRTKDEMKAERERLAGEEEARGSVTWEEVAEAIGRDRASLRGIGGKTDDGDPVSSEFPPVMDTDVIIRKVVRKSGEFARDGIDSLLPDPARIPDGMPRELTLGDVWEIVSRDGNWRLAEVFVEMLGNAGMPTKNLPDWWEGSCETVQGLIDHMRDDSLDAMDTIGTSDKDGVRLPTNRAAYSVDTLRTLDGRMMGGEPLHEARKEEFDVPDDWRPTPNPLGTPVGNPVADRVISMCSKWLVNAVKNWGPPEAFNVEVVRDAFMTREKAKDEAKENYFRKKRNDEIRAEIAEALGKDDSAVTGTDITRWKALKRQDGRCLYCGKPLDYRVSQLDHIIPRGTIGCSNSRDNLAAVCERCNRDKGHRGYKTWVDSDFHGKDRDDFVRETRKVINGITFDEDEFTDRKSFRKFKQAMLGRLTRDSDGDVEDDRWESLGWMAKEIADQVRGYLDGLPVSDSVETPAERVKVYNGRVTSAARYFSGFERRLPWIGGTNEKSRMDLRHHAVDAAAIAVMRPLVAKTLVERDEAKRSAEAEGREPEGVWDHYATFDGVTVEESKAVYDRWLGQMREVTRLVSDAMESREPFPGESPWSDGKKESLVVSSPEVRVVSKRFRLGLNTGRAHEDGIRRFTKRRVGDALSPVAIDKAATEALWCALTRCPDYDPKTGLPEDPERRIRVKERWYGPDDLIDFKEDPKADLDRKRDVMGIPVRNGWAPAGVAIHHARVYRVPKGNGGYKYYLVRVLKQDVEKQIGILRREAKRRAKEESERTGGPLGKAIPKGDTRLSAFTVPLPPQSVSMRSADPKLREELAKGERSKAECVGWLVKGDEIRVRRPTGSFSPDGTGKTSSLVREYGTDTFEVVGFDTATKVSLRPMGLSSAGVVDIDGNTTGTGPSRDWTRDGRRLADRTYHEGVTVKEAEKLNKAVDKVTLSVSKVFESDPVVVRRDSLGNVRWKSHNNMPVSWELPRA